MIVVFFLLNYSESPEDAYLEDMLTIEYVQNPQLLQKNCTIQVLKFFLTYYFPAEKHLTNLDL